MNESNTPQPSPEQLLQLLDAQIKNARAQRGVEGSDKSHTASFVVIGIIVLVSAIALWFMLSMLESMRPARARAATEAAEAR